MFQEISFSYRYTGCSIKCTLVSLKRVYLSSVIWWNCFTPYIFNHLILFEWNGCYSRLPTQSCLHCLGENIGRNNHHYRFEACGWCGREVWGKWSLPIFFPSLVCRLRYFYYSILTNWKYMFWAIFFYPPKIFFWTTNINS